MDIAAPVHSAYISALRFQNEILRLWPKKTVDGELVFDHLMYFYHISGVYQTKEYTDIYALLGTTPAQLLYPLLGGDVQAAYLYLKPYHIDKPETYSSQIRDYVEEFSTMAPCTDCPEGPISINMVYTEQVMGSALTQLDGTTSAAQITAMVLGGMEASFHTTIVPNTATSTSVNVGVWSAWGSSEEPVDDWTVARQALDPADNDEIYVAPHNTAMLTYDTQKSKVTMLSLFDTNEEVFTRTAIVTALKVIPTYETIKDEAYYANDESASYPAPEPPKKIIQYTITADIAYTFERITYTNVEWENAEPAVTKMVEAINTLPKSTNAIYAQIEEYLRHINPVLGSGDLIYVDEPILSSLQLLLPTVLDAEDMDEENANTLPTAKQYIKVGYADYDNPENNIPGAATMKPREFGQMFGLALDTSIIAKDADSWVAPVSVILIAIIIIVSFALAIPTGGGSLALLPETLGLFALYIGIGAIAMTLISIGITKHTGGPNGIVFSGAIIILTTLGTVIGYVLAIIGVYNIVTAGYEVLKKLVNEGIKAISAKFASVANFVLDTNVTGLVKAVSNFVVEAVSAAIEMVSETVTSYFTNTGLGEIMNDGVNALNKASSVYMEYIAPVANPGMPPVDVGGKKEITVEPEMATKISATFDSNIHCEMLLPLETSVYTLTEGTYDNATYPLEKA